MPRFMNTIFLIMKKSLSITSILLFLFNCAVLAEEPDSRFTAYPGYQLVFAEEFNKDGKPDSTIWKYETGYCRNHEHQYYNGDKNCYVKDGVLVIEARDNGKDATPRWTSGSMQTIGDSTGGYSWKYGIYEVRAKVPQMEGCWPAIWSTGCGYEWPYGGEIDIMEYYGKAIHGNVAWGNGRRYGAAWNSAIVSDDDLGEGWGDRFHVWKMIWDPDRIQLWCDDILVNDISLDTTFNVTPPSGSKYGNGDNPFRETRQMLWLNLAIGGDNGGDPEAPSYPVKYLVDYARIYQKPGSDPASIIHIDPL